MSQFQEMWPLSGPTGSKTLKGELSVKDTGHVIHSMPPDKPLRSGLRLDDEGECERFELTEEEFLAAMMGYAASLRVYEKTGGVCWMRGTLVVSGTFEFLDCSKASGVRTADGEWIWNDVETP